MNKYGLFVLLPLLPLLVSAQHTPDSVAPVAQRTAIRFDHIALLVRDVKKSAAFYTDLFDMDSIPVPGGGDGKVYWFVLKNNFQFHLVQGEQDLSMIRFNHIAFSVASVPDFIRQLNRRHIVYFGSNGNYSVSYRPDKVHQIYFKDPDGYEVEVNDRAH